MKYVVRLRRVIEVLVTLFLVTLLTYFLTSRVPGTEADILCSTAPHSCVVHEDQILYLNHGFFARYFHWLGDLLTGNLGNTGVPPEPITSLLSQTWTTTFELIIYSQVIAIAVAVPLAVWSALRANKMFDRVSTAAVFATLAIPTFIIAPILVLVFIVHLSWFPGPGPVPGILTSPLTNLHAMFLPSLALAIGSLAVYQRLLRADMISTLEEDFIVMARAKGLTTSRILFRHALRPSTFTVMTVGGVQIGGLITGAVIVETVFGLNGLGSALVNAVNRTDLPTVQVITIIVAVAFITINFLIDFLYGVIDPRVRRARAI